MTASAGCRPSPFSRGPAAPQSLAIHCLLDGGAYGWIGSKGPCSPNQSGKAAYWQGTGVEPRAASLQTFLAQIRGSTGLNDHEDGSPLERARSCLDLPPNEL